LRRSRGVGRLFILWERMGFNEGRGDSGTLGEIHACIRIEEMYLLELEEVDLLELEAGM